MLLGKPTADEKLSLEKLSKQKLESLFLSWRHGYLYELFAETKNNDVNWYA